VDFYSDEGHGVKEDLMGSEEVAWNTAVLSNTASARTEMFCNPWIQNISHWPLMARHTGNLPSMTAELNF
jgi:hypothetical protein